MNIVIGSAFRDASRLVPRYIAQVQALRKHVGAGHHVRVIAAEGDSDDDTQAELTRRAVAAGLDLQVVECSHGGPRFGSTEEPARLAALTQVGNAILDAVNEEDDVLVYVECDLRWDAHSVGTLIDIAFERRERFDVVAPLVFAGDNFYDVFCFRGLDGARFAPFRPYHSSMKAAGMTEVGSVGSCLVMRAEVARKVRMPAGGVLIGWCQEARGAGYRIAAHADVRVVHP